MGSNDQQLVNIQFYPIINTLLAIAMKFIMSVSCFQRRNLLSIAVKCHSSLKILISTPKRHFHSQKAFPLPIGISTHKRHFHSQKAFPLITPNHCCPGTSLCHHSKPLLSRYQSVSSLQTIAVPVPVCVIIRSPLSMHYVSLQLEIQNKTSANHRVVLNVALVFRHLFLITTETCYECACA